MVIRIFDLEQPSEPIAIIKFEGRMGGIKQVMYTPGNKQLVSFSNDKTVTVTGGEIKSFVITDQIVGKEEMTKDGEILTLTDGNKVIFLDANRLE